MRGGLDTPATAPYPIPAMANHPTPQAFGAWLRDHREALNYTLRAFAEAVDLSPTILSRLETGQDPGIGADSLARVCDVLGLDRWEFFRRAGRVDPALAAMVERPSCLFASFLTTARGWSEAEIAAAINGVSAGRTAAKGPKR